MLMIGDAMGDFTAADAAGAAFYPICPGDEDGSWRLFRDEVSQLFVDGRYVADTQSRYAARLDACLADSPSWDTVD